MKILLILTANILPLVLIQGYAARSFMEQFRPPLVHGLFIGWFGIFFAGIQLYLTYIVHGRYLGKDDLRLRRGSFAVPNGNFPIEPVPIMVTEKS